MLKTISVNNLLSRRVGLNKMLPELSNLFCAQFVCMLFWFSNLPLEENLDHNYSALDLCKNYRCKLFYFKGQWPAKLQRLTILKAHQCTVENDAAKFCFTQYTLDLCRDMNVDHSRKCHCADKRLHATPPKSWSKMCCKYFDWHMGTAFIRTTTASHKRPKV